jgi:hypothetical protein
MFGEKKQGASVDGAGIMIMICFLYTLVPSHEAIYIINEWL